MISPLKLYRTRKCDPDYIRLDDISSTFRKLVVMTEDGAFWGHHGFCYPAIRHAVKVNLKSRSLKAGASTISQQLAKNLYFNFQKSILRKIAEAFVTIRIENTLSKNEILEFYLNMIYFGNNQYGIGNASRFYFDCTPAELNLEQTIHLLTILPGPTYLNPANHPDHLVKRREFTLQCLTEARVVDTDYACRIRENYTEKTLDRLFHIQDKIITDDIVPLSNPLAEDLRKRTAAGDSRISEGSSGLLYSAETAIPFDSDWSYAAFSEINEGNAVLFTAAAHRNQITIGINAGHGTKGGAAVSTWCHPDKSRKITGGTTKEGEVKSPAVSSGMDFTDGTPEAVANLREAVFLKDELLRRGYHVLMVRNERYVQLDNVARALICNHTADCHISIHWDNDGLSYDKGCYYASVPEGLKYLETVAPVWKESHRLGDCLIKGLKKHKNKIMGREGNLDADLTQTSFSTIPNVCMELGNRNSDISDAKLQRLALGLADGIDLYFGLRR